MHNLDTNGWTEFPFEVDGINYVSKVAPTSQFQKSIKGLPAGMFESMNRDAIRDLVGINLSKEDIIDKLNYVNEDASHAVIELV